MVSKEILQLEKAKFKIHLKFKWQIEMENKPIRWLSTPSQLYWTICSHSNEFLSAECNPLIKNKRWFMHT